MSGAASGSAKSGSESERVIPGFVRGELDAAYSTLFLNQRGTLQGSRHGPLSPDNEAKERKKKLHRAIRLSGSTEQAGNGLFALERTLKFFQECEQPKLPAHGPVQLIDLD